MLRTEQDQKREVRQLWFVSEMYFDLAKNRKDQVKQDALNWTIRELAAKCESDQGMKENADLVCAVAHLMSCAVRLFAIEECIDSPRNSQYKRILNYSDQTRIRQAIEESLDCYIHFLLRHMVAHHEDEWKRRANKRKETAFKIMNEIYWKMNFNTMFEKMRGAKAILRIDIEAKLNGNTK